MAKKLKFDEALSIVYTLAVAARATAETSMEVTDEVIDEAFAMMDERLKSLQKKFYK